MTPHAYGVRLMPTWPHISLGISLHLDRKYGHLSLHLPIGVLVLGFIGADPITVNNPIREVDTECEEMLSAAQVLRGETP